MTQGAAELAAELAATGSSLDCGEAEALMAARAAGPLAGEAEQRLRQHLAACASCAEVASSLDAPEMAEAWTGAAELAHDFDDLLEVASDNYVRGIEIGRGGMGHIMRARDRRLGRVVAIKQLLDPQLRARFEHEARLTARLQHPAIVPIYEAGRWPNGEPFYAMKYVAGRPLDAVIASLAKLGDRLGLLPNLIAVVEAIAYAHSEGVVHRDVKPQNIVIGAFGETVIIDWGLAKDLASSAEPAAAVADPRAALTVAGAGTPAYMPPEQARGEPPTERSDIYALGATLHHLVAGDRPDLQPLPEATPRDVRAIIAKAMAAAPHDRYQTAKQLAVDLRAFMAGGLVSSYRYSLRDLALRWAARHRALVAASLVFLGVLTAVVAVSLGVLVRANGRATASAAEARSRLVEAREDQGRRLVLAGDPGRGLLYDAARLATASQDGTARVWDVATGRELARVSGSNFMQSARFDPSGRRLITANSDRNVRVWDAVSGQLLHSLDDHRDAVVQASFDASGQLAVTAGYDGTARIWEVVTQRVVGVLPHRGRVSAAAFVRGGAAVITGSLDDGVRTWNTALEARPPAEVAALVACRVPLRLVDGVLLPGAPPASCFASDLRLPLPGDPP